MISQDRYIRTDPGLLTCLLTNEGQGSAVSSLYDTWNAPPFDAAGAETSADTTAVNG